MRKLFVLLSLIVLVGCGSVSDELPLESVAETGETKEYAQELTVALNSQNITVFVNETEHHLSSYIADNRAYFLLDDIACIFDGTQARFRFSRDFFGSDFYINRFNVVTSWGTQISDTYTTTIQPSVTSMVTGVGLSDFAMGSYNTLDTPSGVHFTLEDLAGFLGFTIQYGEDTILINTHEPNISEFGHTLLVDFLRQRQTFFFDRDDWTDEMLAATPNLYIRDVHENWTLEPAYAYPTGFMLYDLNNSGIPDIFVHYGEDLMFWHYVVYTYADGGYIRSGFMPPHWVEFFRDEHGRIFSFIGSHHDGWVEASQLIFQDDGIYQEFIVRAPWTLEFEDEEERYSAQEDWETFWANWSFFSPTSPLDPDEPITSIRPLTFLQRQGFLAR